MHLQRLSDALGAEIWCKRDDLTGFGLSGNKVRKLEFLLAGALQQGVDTVITTGGAQSNHARATAVAARRLGLSPLLLLRGEPSEPPRGNLLLDRLLGARIEWIGDEAYRTSRAQRMAALAGEIEAAGGRALVIPEGGSNGLGALGFVEAAAEVRRQLQQLPAGPDGFDGVVLPVGSAGTLAGLALGLELGPLLGVAVCDDRQTFSPIVHRIAEEAAALGAGPLPQEGERWRIVEGYQGPGYGIATPEIWQTIRWVAQLEGLLLDPSYTGKAMCALVSEVRAGRLGGRLLFWHTGGGFGLFGRGEEIAT